MEAITCNKNSIRMEVYKCPKCEGKPLQPKVINNITFTNCLCDFCYGKKNLDWLEYIFGVNPSDGISIKNKYMLKLMMSDSK